MIREEAIKNVKRELCRDCGIYLGGGRKCSENCSVIETINALSAEPILDRITEIIEPLRHLSIDEMSGIEWQILQVINKYNAELRNKP